MSIAICAVILAVVSAPLHAQEYPNRVVRLIVPYLRAAGVKALDMLIVSHDDVDHYGGASSVLQAMPVAQLLTSVPELDPLRFEAERAGPCFAAG